MAAKLDLKKGALKPFYTAPKNDVVVVDVPLLQFLMIDGTGDPNGSAFQEAMGALYAMAYTLKFASKEAGQDFTVMPLEGLWWADDIAEFSLENRDIWRWTAMILQPEHITAGLFEAAVEQVRTRKNPPGLDRVRLEVYHEGLAAQIMHTGPYADEGPTVARLHTWIEANGYTYHGAKYHHEIYLSDPNRSKPENMKTIIRQPVIPAAG